MSDYLGKFAWFELMTTDPDAASFYADVIGWTATASDMPGMGGYTLFRSNDTEVAGLMMLPDDAIAQGATPSWMAYVGVLDLDAVVAQVPTLGGHVLVPQTDIPSIGRFAIIVDPQGAAIAAFQPSKDMPGDDQPARMGEFRWVELCTTDWDGGLSFYSTLFGWERTQSMDMGPKGVYQMYGRLGETIGGAWNGADGKKPRWLYYVRVPDVKQAIDKATALGGTLIQGPTEVPGGALVAQLQDPQGAVFAVHSSPKD